MQQVLQEELFKRKTEERLMVEGTCDVAKESGQQNATCPRAAQRNWGADAADERAVRNELAEAAMTVSLGRSSRK